jgi:glutamate carboxypeptidase
MQARHHTQFDPRERRTVTLLQELCAISSASADAAGLRQAAELLASALRPRGFDVAVRAERSADGVWPMLVAGTPGALAGRPCLLLLGHLDTVLPAAPPRLLDDRLVATGAIDMKGGLAAFVGALALVAERGDTIADDLLLVVVPDEEIAGEISQRAVAQFGAQARAVWVLEPGEPTVDADAETMVAGRRGTFPWRLDVWGKAAHSGLHYWQGRSALTAAARFATAAAALSQPGDGPTVNAGRLVAGDTSFVENLPTNGDLVGTERQLNVVPDRAIVEGEARFLRRAEGERVEASLTALAERIASESDVRVDFVAAAHVPPVDPDGPQRAWCDRAVALAAARDWRLEIETQRGGISFPNFLPDPGRVPVLDGLGPVGGGMHTREEFVFLRSLARRTVLLADLLVADAAAVAAARSL